MKRTDELVAFLREILGPYFLGQGTWHKSGTYSPTYGGETTFGTTTYAANGQVGHWRRYGDLVYAYGRVEWTAATGTGNAIISLPFTAVNVTNLGMPGSLDTTTVTFANGTPTLLVPINTAFFRMRSPLTNAAITNVAIEAAGIVNFGVWFEVA